MSMTLFDSPSFAQLSQEIDAYLKDSWGSGIDVPAWIRSIDKEVHEATDPEEGGRPGAEAEIQLPEILLTLTDFRDQLRRWKETVRSGRNRAAGDTGRRPPRGRRGRKPRE